MGVPHAADPTQGWCYFRLILPLQRTSVAKVCGVQPGLKREGILGKFLHRDVLLVQQAWTL